MAGLGLEDPDSKIDSRIDEVKRRQFDPNVSSNLNEREQAGYDREFNDIASNYGDTADPGQENANIDKLRDAEESGVGASGFYNPSGYGGKATSRQSARFLSNANMKAILKKRGVWGLLATVLLGGGAAGIIMFSPALLIIHMKEVMVNKFNMQLASMEDRTTKLINYKMSKTTSGLCGSVVSVKCKYATMSKDQISTFKDAGIDIEGDALEGDRIKPTKLTFNNEEILPENFSKAVRDNSAFAAAVRKAYNPTYIGFSDKVWNAVRSKFGISKTAPKEAANDTERADELDREVRNGMDETEKIPKVGDPKDPNCKSNCDTWKEPEVEQLKAANQQAASLEQQAADAAKSGKSPGQTALTEVADKGPEAILAEGGPKTFTPEASLGNFFKATGYIDDACQAYGALQAVGYAAKTVRAVQLARYAMAFLKTADMIKAGTAKPEDVAYMGGILTEVTYDAKSAVNRTYGTATDSFGFKYAAYGDKGASSKSMTLASQFLVGGGLTGDLINLSKIINEATGGAPKETCRVLGNPVVGAASLVGGVAMLFIPGVNFTKVASQVAVQAAFSVGMMILPELLKDIVAGTVADSNTKGEAAGDAITSGSGVMMSELAARGGNAPLTPDQAVAYNEQQNEVLAYNQKLDRATMSPLDPTSSSTFMGSIVATLTPSLTHMSSLSGALYSIGSIFPTSLKGLMPNSFAATALRTDFALCPDLDYNNLDGHGQQVATDPFCNIYYGIPRKYLAKDPGLVVDELAAAGDLDRITDEPKGKYVDFRKNCIDRERPLGDQGADQQGSSGSECIINDSNANYYLHAVDQRISDAMEHKATE